MSGLFLIFVIMAVSDKGRKNKTRTTKKSVITKSSRKKPGRTLKYKTVIDKATGKEKKNKRKSTSSWANLKSKGKVNIKTGAWKQKETGKVKETGRKFKSKRKLGPIPKSGGIRTSAGYAREPKKSVEVDKTATSNTREVTKNGKVRGKQIETFNDGDKMRRRYKDTGNKVKTRSVVKSPSGDKSLVKFKETKRKSKTVVKDPTMPTRRKKVVRTKPIGKKRR
jgi:hypothetical protein